jgi:MraZ protein
MLLGQYLLPINDQGQLTLPSNLCAAMDNHVYLTQGFDRNLLLLTAESFERIYSYLKNTSMSDPLARLLVRLFLGSAVEMNINDAGEIQIPPGLREYSGVEEKIVMVGQGDYFEIWAPLFWDEQIISLRDYQANVNRFAKFNLATA